MGDPYVPLQAGYASAPWRVLVVCALLNLMSRDQVRPILQGLFALWPTAEVMADADYAHLEEYLRPLGLSEQRTRRLMRMSTEFKELNLLSGWHVEQLFACGKYAADSFRVFCQGDISQLPGDRVLREYVEVLRGLG